MNFKPLYILSILLLSTDNRASNNLQFYFEEDRNDFLPISSPHPKDNSSKNKSSSLSLDPQDDDELQFELEGEFNNTSTILVITDDFDRVSILSNNTKDLPSLPYHKTDEYQNPFKQTRDTIDTPPFLEMNDSSPTPPVRIIYPENYQGRDW